MPTYAEKLKDPRWQQTRLRIMERDGFACVKCGSKTETLHVHHGGYERGLDPWEYDPEVLWTLCEPCHDWTTATMAQIYRDIAEMPPGPALMVLAVEVNDFKWRTSGKDIGIPA